MKIGMITLGCPKNLVDSEIILGSLRENEYEITTDLSESEVIIVNTCAFIESAQEEAIETILQAAEYKKKHCKCLIVAGCLAQRYKQEIIEQMPEVDMVIGPGEYKNIIKIINNATEQKNRVDNVFCSDLGDISYLEGKRLLSDSLPYKYLKIAEGCNNCCSYCIIPKLRGRFKSREVHEVINEAKWLSEKNCKEIILVAQDVTMYGNDLDGQDHLPLLINELSKINNLEWIRLLYCYPERINDKLIKEIKLNTKVVKYLDLPIQHISDNMLEKMNRRSNRTKIMDTIHKLKNEIPEIVLRTSLITGFPGETEKDFNELLEFIDLKLFDRVGVFKYSREEGTKAYNMPDQIDEQIKQERFDLLMNKQRFVQISKNEDRLNKIYKVLVEGVAEDGIFYTGRSFAEAPDIDNIIYFTSPQPLNSGQFVDVKILNVDGYDLIGEVVL